jgi:hypothetical protein
MSSSAGNFYQIPSKHQYNQEEGIKIYIDNNFYIKK